MNEQSFIRKICENARLRGQAQAYDFALFLIEMYGADEAVSRIEKKRDEVEERERNAFYNRKSR